MSSQLSTVCVDLDSTIIPWGSIWAFPKPLPGVRDALKELHTQGYIIYILTSRLSDRWCEEAYVYHGYDSAIEFKLAQTDHIKYLLDMWGVPYDDIGAEKVPALAYFDDLAVRVTPEYPLPAAIYDLIEGNR